MPPIRTLSRLRVLIAAAACAAISAPLHAAQPLVLSPPPGNLGAMPATPAPAPVAATAPAPVIVTGTQPMSATSSNTSAADTKTTWAPSLPAPAVDDEAPPAAFLDAARRAIAANRTGEAQEALERAESRALDRSVKPSNAGQPSGQPLVKQIAAARHALSAGDRQMAVQLIEKAMKHPEASAPAN